MKTVKDFFNEYANALLSFSAEKIAAFYQVPLAIYSDNGVHLVDDMDAVTGFWKEGMKPYAEQKIEKSTTEILYEEQLSQNIYLAKVFWKNYDTSGREVATETNVYILSKDGNYYKISGLLIMVPVN